MAKRKVQPTMKFEKSKSGMGVIKINTGAYLSFGSSERVKFVSIRIDNAGKLFPIAMLKLPTPYTKEIGTKNIKRIRELVRERLVDGFLTQDKVMELGEIINREGQSK